MNAKFVAALLVGALLGFGAASLVKTPEAHAQRQEAAPVPNGPTLEFKVLTFTDNAEAEKELAKLAADRWQYVGLINTVGGGPGGNSSMVAFKRITRR